MFKLHEYVNLNNTNTTLGEITMSLNIYELFVKDGKIKKGNALFVPLLFLSCAIIYAALTSAISYAQEYKMARDKVEKAFVIEHTAINKNVAELKTKVDNKVPLTKGDVQEQLNGFAKEQKQLYKEQLQDQATVRAVQQEAGRELVKGWLDTSRSQQNAIHQAQLANSKELGGLASSVTAQKELVDTMLATSIKDREALKVLTQNNNNAQRKQDEFNRNTSIELKEVLQQLQLISKKLEQDL